MGNGKKMMILQQLFGLEEGMAEEEGTNIRRNERIKENYMAVRENGHGAFQKLEILGEKIANGADRNEWSDGGIWGQF